MKNNSYCTYVTVDNLKLFTVVLFPNDKNEKHPTVVMRSPYVDHLENKTENEILDYYASENQRFLKYGYAVVIQHCRGRGKSDGDCIPYVNEHKDTNALYDFIKKQSFYNGELYLFGGSYTTSVHYLAAPYADDIKGAIFGVQDNNRYNLCYRNGFFKKALIGDWYVGMYKAKSKMKKNFTMDSYDILPLTNFSKTVFGEEAEELNKILKSPYPTDEYYQTENGGAIEKHALDNANFPILFTTGFYDIYTGGIFDMWNNLSPNIRKNCALVVSSYDHGDHYNEQNGLAFENAKRTENFGNDYEPLWFEHIRKNTPLPYQKGKVTHYTLFENKWHTDEFKCAKNQLTVKLGNETKSYDYDPSNAPSFKGGLSCNFGGAEFQDKPNLRKDIISVYTEPFTKDTYVIGKMLATLSVSSNCEDTCFYMRVSIEKEKGDFGLRDDITSLCYQLGNYKPNTVVNLKFTFDEHSFLIKKGERLRIDVSSADKAHYIPHTNQKGLFTEQTKTKTAKNTVYLQNSYLYLLTK